ncbi:sporulation-delaying protein SdpB family protein [Rhodococcoides yunnanense]|uniref:HTTM-like domain-containing protein n=1 Tax=Rhodococcoides yunnanense TaxID=278209 RepID=A0ABU4BCM3_9NOCA|nr:sporulation-delaying protein SdpB family protein [Rhodococcus yunnanensis]MDV6261947.1 hypothetical protein [Rhodococcus yunnanensis]
MPVVNAVAERIASSILAYPSRSRMLGIGRTIIAIGQLSVLVFTPQSYLFVPLAGMPQSPQCDTTGSSLLAYCMFGGLAKNTVAMVIGAILVAVIIGVLPRVTGVLHYWASVSMGTAFALPDGGEQAAQVATFFLMFALVNDNRIWHWQLRGAPDSAGVFQGIAWAAGWALRLQMAYIYLNASISKIAVSDWSDGTAVYYVVRGESFGVGNFLQSTILAITAVPLLALIASWGTIAIEAATAVLILGRGRVRLVGLLLSIFLHIAFIAAIGLWSFALIMVGLMVCATTGWNSSRRESELEVSNSAVVKMHETDGRRQTDSLLTSKDPISETIRPTT